MNLYVEMIDARGLYRLGLSVEIKTLVMSQADWGVLSSEKLRVRNVARAHARGEGVAYIECAPASLMPWHKWVLITRLNTYLNTKRSAHYYL